MRFTFLHAADLHLDSPLKGLEKYEGAPAESLRNATRDAFENLVTLAIEENVAFVLLSGDIYDGDWKDYNTGLFFSAQMNRLNREDIPVYMIRGNHDAASLITKELTLPKNVHEFPVDWPGTILIESLKTAIHGRGFETRAVTENLAGSYPKAVEGFLNIGLLHTSMTGREGHENYAPCHVEDLLAKGYDYWALGHIHMREMLRKSDPVILFPGNIQGRHIRETGKKGCSLVHSEDGEITHVEHRTVDVIRWCDCQIDLTDVSSPDEMLHLFGEKTEELYRENGGRFLAVRVHLTGKSPLHEQLALNTDHFVNNIRAKALEAGGEIWVEKVKIHTTPEADRDALASSNPALAFILDYLYAIEEDEEELHSILEEVSDLNHALPPSLKETGSDQGFYGSDAVKSRRERIEDLLVHKLAGKGEV
ncbi:DNA repair exonuclease [Alteribacter lacisalsi]|uniref:DNA repair exonuclease n=1 Tax=Alteribacter lacisalsi TaxID=2045244 RepID=A0A2W0HBK9_9BACI|nr:DNA repair exonuclease [Alteribacter lacisalsi]PYZ98216.1 DNA repair exonuclease [Alteribacter lacisalsi]